MDWDALRLSLQVGLTATAFSVVVGVPLAWWIARLRPGWRETASALVLVPMVLPPTVLGYYLLQAVGRRSFIGSALEDAFGFSFVFDWTGAVLAAFVVSLPFLVRTVQAGFESVDRAYEEAARTLGRGELSIFMTVAVPLAWRSVLAGVALAFGRAVGEFGATLMIAGNVPGRTRTISSEAQILALTLTLATLGLLIAVGLAARKGVPSWR